MDTDINNYVNDFTTEKYNFKLSRKDIKVILQMLTWGQLHIIRELKKCGQSDFDVKEFYGFYRYYSHVLAEKLRQFE